MATIYDIAELCNTSPATVSRALKDDNRISEETKEKVQKVARELKYQPNGIARSLKLGKSHTLGVITNDIATFAVPRIIDGIEKEANKRKYNLILCNSSYSLEKERLYINILEEKQVEGIIFVGTWAELDNRCNFLETEKPVVAINRHYQNDKICTINHDDVYVSYLAANYLAEKGYKKIAFINGPMNEVSPPGRLEGFKKAVKDRSLKTRSDWIKEGDWYFDSGYKITDDILQDKERPEAIIAGNDYMAVGAIRALNRAGLKVPDDIGVIGCDNRSITQNFNPEITTVQLPLFKMGEAAAVNVLNAILKDEDMGSQILKSSIIERDSA